MGFNKDEIKAVLFDYGNTIIEYGPIQISRQYSDLKDELIRLFGDCDDKRLKVIRDLQVVKPYKNGYRENDLNTTTQDLIQGLYNIIPEDYHINALIKRRYKSFVEAAELSEDVLQLLDTLSRHYKLGLISNYPCGRSIRASLEKIGLKDVFESVVVSGDIGYVKPHEKPFRVMLDHLALRPGQCVYVGDNWLADVQGAKRVGMSSVQTLQHSPYEKFEPEKGDFEPDLKINNIAELEGLLL